MKNLKNKKMVEDDESAAQYDYRVGKPIRLPIPALTGITSINYPTLLNLLVNNSCEMLSKDIWYPAKNAPRAALRVNI